MGSPGWGYPSPWQQGYQPWPGEYDQWSNTQFSGGKRMAMPGGAESPRPWQCGPPCHYGSEPVGEEVAFWAWRPSRQHLDRLEGELGLDTRQVHAWQVFREAVGDPVLDTGGGWYQGKIYTPTQHLQRQGRQRSMERAAAAYRDLLGVLGESQARKLARAIRPPHRW